VHGSEKDSQYGTVVVTGNGQRGYQDALRAAQEQAGYVATPDAAAAPATVGSASEKAYWAAVASAANEAPGTDTHTYWTCVRFMVREAG
jgi:RNA-splicing ligase RtcB